jgi:hypothetical protein
LIKAFKAVFWSFLGIRKGEEHKKDISSLKLRDVILAGIIGGLFFVLSLILLVKLVVS